jgi:4-methyl-5(b-hydroxyethyl)-thiazole monophosphate biosynthesis
MAKVLLPLADGFEEIEAVTIVDVLRRAGVEVVIAATQGDSAVGSHGIRVGADSTLEGVVEREFDAVVLPGGQPGSNHLRADQRLRRLLAQHAAKGRLVAAICAAPTVLEAAGILAGKRATCYPGEEIPSAEFSFDRVVEDDNVITSRAAGTALEFALVLARRLAGHETATQLRQRMLAKT